MTPEEFRRWGHEAVDWAADYLSYPEHYPVLPPVEPGGLLAALPENAPEEGEPFETILADFQNRIVPGITHWNHPGFFGYFSVTGSPPGVLAELLAATLNNNGMLWKTGPAATELEQRTLAWLLNWLGLPRDWFGIIFDTASTSTLHALAAARLHAHPATRVDGAPPDLVVYTSEQAHSSVEKGAIALGMGQRNVRKIPTDDAFRMQPGSLREAIAADRAAGLRPCCIVATVGTTSTTSIDPVPEIAAIARETGIWLHVDAAYGGAAAVAEEYRHVLDGCEQADSLVVNPHKWLGTPVDLSAFYTRRPEVLREAFSLLPDYLRTAEEDRAVNFMEYGVPLGRRFRSLKLWFVMRAYGRKTVADILRQQIAWARELAAEIAAHPDFEVSAPAPLSLVCFRMRGSDDANRALLDRVNASGDVLLSHTVLRGRFVLRLAIGNWATRRNDVQHAWSLVRQAAAAR
ncbi:MAG: amino acid decarboxylase [Bryobacterales bacterium]|nr:amino acid decarboxylase [Bryobacterales bacterium]